MPKINGALPDFMIRDLMASGAIRGASPNNVMPASLNLSVSEEAYRIEDVFQLEPGERVLDVLSSVGAVAVTPGMLFERGVNYLVRLNEWVGLPEDIYGYCNPRSSVGRNDILVRVIGDGSPRYDAAAPAGYQGDLWALVSPKSYSVNILPKQMLTQLRLFTDDTRFTEPEMERIFGEQNLLWRREGLPFSYDEIKVSDRDGSVILTVDLEGDIVGWECLGSPSSLDFSKKNFYQPEKFFRPLRKSDGDRIRLEKEGFYILYTAERVRVPPHLACEMVAMDARSGEFRSHYAGFIDPGWGYGEKGEGKGRRLVLEVRPFERIIFRHKQAAAKIRFERMCQVPELHYDQLPGSSYTRESTTPRLSSQFQEV
jgi:dCTP deaminase